jgi:hypothetical protein
MAKIVQFQVAPADGGRGGSWRDDASIYALDDEGKLWFGSMKGAADLQRVEWRSLPGPPVADK